MRVVELLRRLSPRTRRQRAVGLSLVSAATTLTLEQAERRMIEQVLAQHEGNISRVAKALGLSRAALYRRLEKHGLATGNEDAP